jgi:hypothetical protein
MIDMSWAFLALVLLGLRVSGVMEWVFQPAQMRFADIPADGGIGRKRVPRAQRY